MLPPELEFNKLIEQVAAGDQAAFRTLYQKTTSRFFAIAILIVRDRDLASDVLQECYLKIWKRAGQFDARKGTPNTWLASIVRNHALDEVRKRKRQPPTVDVHDLEIATSDVDQLSHMVFKDEVARLKKRLQGLEPERRQIFYLAYFGGMSRKELGHRFQRPEGTIKTWLHRSVKQLRYDG